MSSITPTDPAFEEAQDRIALWLAPVDLRWLAQYCGCPPDATEEVRERCARIRFRASAALHKARVSHHFEYRILDSWADALASLLHRSPEEIRAHGLSASDFPANREIRLRFPDQSTVSFRHALHVINPAGSQIALFTEHCGYHVFPAGDTELEMIDHTWSAEDRIS